MPKIDSDSINRLDLTEGTIAKLNKLGVYKISTIFKLGEEQMLLAKGIGQSTIREIKYAMYQRRYSRAKIYRFRHVKPTYSWIELESKLDDSNVNKELWRIFA